MNMLKMAASGRTSLRIVNFEPITIGLKICMFDWDHVWNLFQICLVQLQKKWGRKLMEKVPLEGGGVPTPNGKSFHFFGPSLRLAALDIFGVV